MTNRTLPLGLVIIAAGIVILLGKLGLFYAIAAWLWPLALIAAGAWLHWAVWQRKLPGLALIVGAVLAGMGITFLICAWFGWYWMRAFWPLIPLSLAVGLLECAAADRMSSLRIGAFALGGLSIAALLITMFAYLNGYVVALLLIVAGVVIVARKPNFR
ncbi:hypothetical protein MO973_05680 [Paenibacillus sp. TRM 82003]|nr:hypothetical protein [Paenibacillus sp. TRM 82003]